MENKPKISVLIPCYEQAQYLQDAIESVLKQTIKPHEIIVISDGSPDNTSEIVKQYPVKYIEQVNKGLPSARNTGIMNATGDWILPLDADDMMTENCIERVSKFIETTGADIIAPSFKEFGVRDNTIILMENPTFEDFMSANRIGYFSAIRKDALLEIGGYSPKMLWGWEDYHLWFDLLSRGKKIFTIPEVLILYRVKENSMINESNKHASELWTQIDKDFPGNFT